MNILGIEIGGTKLQLLSGDEQGRILERHRFGVDPSAGAKQIRRQIEETIKERFGKTRLDAVGVGFGGPVDWRTGTICRSHQVEGWTGFGLKDWLQGLTGTRVEVDNDANVAALAEARRGAGQGSNPVFYVTLGSGVGGGLIVEGSIYHGALPGESEIGHLRLDRTGTVLESRCSGWALDARIRQLRTAHPESALCRAAAGVTQGEARFLADASQAGDALAGKLLEELSGDLAFGLSHVVHLMHPEAIVLGGGLAFVGEPLRGAVEAALRRFVMDAFLPAPRVALAGLGEDVVPVGALLLARKRT